MSGFSAAAREREEDHVEEDKIVELGEYTITPHAIGRKRKYIVTRKVGENREAHEEGRFDTMQEAKCFVSRLCAVAHAKEWLRERLLEVWNELDARHGRLLDPEDFMAIKQALKFEIDAAAVPHP